MIPLTDFAFRSSSLTILEISRKRNEKPLISQRIEWKVRSAKNLNFIALRSGEKIDTSGSVPKN